LEALVRPLQLLRHGGQLALAGVFRIRSEDDRGCEQQGQHGLFLEHISGRVHSQDTIAIAFGARARKGAGPPGIGPRAPSFAERGLTPCEPCPSRTSRSSSRCAYRSRASHPARASDSRCSRGRSRSPPPPPPSPTPAARSPSPACTSVGAASPSSSGSTGRGS